MQRADLRGGKRIVRDEDVELRIPRQLPRSQWCGVVKGHGSPPLARRGIESEKTCGENESRAHGLNYAFVPNIAVL